MEHFKNLNIHLIEENKICKERFLFYLRNMGFTNISTYRNGLECLVTLNTRPDVIIMSQGADAWESLGYLKRIKEINPDVYVIFVAEKKDASVPVSAQNFGAFDYFFKGYQLESMLHISMQKVLDVINLLNIKPVKSRMSFMSFYTL